MNLSFDGISQIISDCSDVSVDANLHCDGNPTLPDITPRCDNCDLPVVIIEPSEVPPYFPENAIAFSENSNCAGHAGDNTVADHFQTMNMEVTKIVSSDTPPLLGGGKVKCEHISFSDENGNTVYVIGDFEGKTQLWSGGAQHYELDDENGNHISFTKNPDGTVSNFERSEGVVIMDFTSPEVEINS